LQKSGRTAPSELSVLTSYNLLLLVNVVFNVSERERERKKKNCEEEKKTKNEFFEFFFKILSCLFLVVFSFLFFIVIRFFVVSRSR
jgi:Na+/melibiose symporter-like transporter